MIVNILKEKGGDNLIKNVDLIQKNLMKNIVQQNI